MRACLRRSFRRAPRHAPALQARRSVEAAASIAAAVAAGELTATGAAELAKVIDTYVGALATRGFGSSTAIGWGLITRINPAMYTRMALMSPASASSMSFAAMLS